MTKKMNKKDYLHYKFAKPHGMASKHMCMDRKSYREKLMNI